MGGTLTKVDIGHGRGWLAPAPAASLRRIDAQLGRLADINEAGRSPEQANENRRKWLAYERYLNGGPWAPKAPYALGADQSVHCWGYAADSDDWYNANAAAVWRANGWRQTARYPGNKAKDEPWHGEYSETLDQYRHGGAAVAGGEDAMSAQAEQYISNMHAAIFGPQSVGGADLKWANKDGARRGEYGILDIITYNQQLIAALTGQLSAMSNVVEQLAAGSGAVLDMDAIAAAAERGTRNVLSGLVLTADLES